MKKIFILSMLIILTGNTANNAAQGQSDQQTSPFWEKRKECREYKKNKKEILKNKADNLFAQAIDECKKEKITKGKCYKMSKYLLNFPLPNNIEKQEWKFHCRKTGKREKGKHRPYAIKAEKKVRWKRWVKIVMGKDLLMEELAKNIQKNLIEPSSESQGMNGQNVTKKEQRKSKEREKK